MAKLPYMQFYPLDWLRDSRKLSPNAKAAWIDILAIAWNEPVRGTYTRRKDSMCRELGVGIDELQTLIAELVMVADVTQEGENVTVMSRRMAKDERAREYERNKKRWQREREHVPELSPCSPPIVPQEKLEVRSQKLDRTKDMRGELPPRAFDLLWERYPKKKGRIAAEKHFRKSVKSTRDWLDIQNALENYLREIRKENIDAQFVKHGSTWFFNWRDDVSYKGVEMPRPPAPKPRAPEVLPPDPTDEDLKFMHDTKIKAMGPCRDPECRYCPKVAVHV